MPSMFFLVGVLSYSFGILPFCINKNAFGTPARPDDLFSRSCIMAIDEKVINEKEVSNQQVHRSSQRFILSNSQQQDEHVHLVPLMPTGSSKVYHLKKE